jgi:hypothetical protein
MLTAFSEKKKKRPLVPCLHTNIFSSFRRLSI